VAAVDAGGAVAVVLDVAAGVEGGRQPVQRGGAPTIALSGFVVTSASLSRMRSQHGKPGDRGGLVDLPGSVRVWEITAMAEFNVSRLRAAETRFLQAAQNFTAEASKPDGYFSFLLALLKP